MNGRTGPASLPVGNLPITASYVVQGADIMSQSIVSTLELNGDVESANSPQGVTVETYRTDEETTAVTVNGPTEIHDPQLAAAILEYLASSRDWKAVNKACEAAIKAADEREAAADEALQFHLARIGDGVVIFRGLAFQHCRIDEFHPAGRAIMLLD